MYCTTWSLTLDPRYSHTPILDPWFSIVRTLLFSMVADIMKHSVVLGGALLLACRNHPCNFCIVSTARHTVGSRQPAPGLILLIPRCQVLLREREREREREGDYVCMYTYIDAFFAWVGLREYVLRRVLPRCTWYRSFEPSICLFVILSVCLYVCTEHPSSARMTCMDVYSQDRAF